MCIDENTLYIYKFINGTGWVKMVAGNPSYCIANGRNTTANYVWVNVTECSTFLLTGTPIEAPTPPSSGSSSGGGGVGVGVGTSNEPGNVEETVVLRIYLGAGDSATYNFNNVVTSIEVTPERTYGLVAAKIEVLAGQPGSIFKKEIRAGNYEECNPPHSYLRSDNPYMQRCVLIEIRWRVGIEFTREKFLVFLNLNHTYQIYIPTLHTSLRQPPIFSLNPPHILQPIASVLAFSILK